MWYVEFTKQAAKDAKKLKAAGLDKKAKALIAILRNNPFEVPPSYEGVVGNLSGLYSRRISLQHRLVYSVKDKPIELGNQKYEGVVRVVRMRTHYDDIR